MHSSSIGIATDLRAGADLPPPPGISTANLVVLPYQGIFTYRVGSKAQTYDAASTLFVTRAQEYADAHPCQGIGHASLILKPNQDLLDEICGTRRGAIAHDAFILGKGPSQPAVQLMTQQLLRGSGSALERDELFIRAIRAALGSRVPMGTSPALRMVELAKQFLHESGFEDFSLGTVARAVGASPAYLTSEFGRSEGLPLYRYYLLVRLNEALLRLPRSDDITMLALDLGFHSHSHFSAAFRAAYGVSPSRYRATVRKTTATTDVLAEGDGPRALFGG